MGPAILSDVTVDMECYKVGKVVFTVATLDGFQQA